MKPHAVDFATWFSGMDRAKVEAAYNRWQKERVDVLSERIGPTHDKLCDCDECVEVWSRIRNIK